jgi:CRP-like cAMP-binding protein
MSSENGLLPLVRAITRLHPLAESDRAALLDLPFTVAPFGREKMLVRQGDKVTHCSVLLTGYLYRTTTTPEGGRQIFGVQFPGDLVDLHNALFAVADHSVYALTRSTVASIPVGALLDLASTRRGICLAIWTDLLVDGAMQRELVVDIGRRSAKQRIAHYLCEFGMRSEMAGLGRRTAFAFPLTQDHLADLLGLTPVHVNRTLRSLDDMGLLTRKSRAIRINDFPALADVAGFQPDYLHAYAGNRDATPGSEPVGIRGAA